MNKIVIPSGVAVLICSIPVAYKAFAVGSTDLMSKAYMLAALSAAVFLLLLLDYLIRGLHNISNLEQIAIREEKLEQRFQIERLYTGNKEHSDEFLSGFASAAEFFIENYLADSNPGPTEKAWYEYASKAYAMDFINTARLYRTYMVNALMHRSGITEDEYEKIARMTSSETVRKIYGKTFYQPSALENEIRLAERQFNETRDEKEKEDTDR